MSEWVKDHSHAFRCVFDLHSLTQENVFANLTMKEVFIFYCLFISTCLFDLIWHEKWEFMESPKHLSLYFKFCFAIFVLSMLFCIWFRYFWRKISFWRKWGFYLNWWCFKTLERKLYSFRVNFTVAYLDPKASIETNIHRYCKLPFNVFFH